MDAHTSKCLDDHGSRLLGSRQRQVVIVSLERLLHLSRLKHNAYRATNTRYSNRSLHMQPAMHFSTPSTFEYMSVLCYPNHLQL